MNIILIVLILALIAIGIIMGNLTKKTSSTKNRIYTQFFLLSLSLLVHISGLILQILFENTTINPIYFDYIAYVGGSFTPIILFNISLLFRNEKVDLKKMLFVCILPVASMIVLWTNELHHWFYIEYSVNLSETVTGWYAIVHIIYSYLFLITSFYIMLKGSIKKSGFLSAQTCLILLGVMAPLVPNILGTLKIIPMTIYITPIMYIITAICFYIAIFKLKALNVIPVAFKTIINTMSDAFVVISEDGTIADLNKTFIDKFRPLKEFKDKDNLFDLIKDSEIVRLEDLKENISKAKTENKTITVEYEIKKDTFDKYFEIDFQPIKSKDNTEYVATLVLLRDITDAKKDMEIMMKNESLVTLGELAGGVAHDINTPISAIKSGLLMFKDIAKSDDEKMLVDSMNSCADKIVTLTNSLRNQIRNIGSDEVADVNITTVIKDVNVILHNELSKNGAVLNLDIQDDIIVKGNAAKLSQVITNIVVNAIQAYNTKGGKINVTVFRKGKLAVISVQDFAGGIPESIRDNIGKNILTTKGVSGTGFGLYLAYSVIKGAFGGEITFDSQTGIGTTFYITIPLE